MKGWRDASDACGSPERRIRESTGSMILRRQGLNRATGAERLTLVERAIAARPR